MPCCVTILNPKTGLSKMVDISEYSKTMLEKMVSVYLDADFDLYFIRG